MSKAIIDRIEKLMAMATHEGSNPNEAADVEMNQVKREDAGALSKNSRRIPDYLSVLVEVIANTFECRAIYSQNFHGTTVVYYGFGSDPVLAKYSLAVLKRQLIKARQEFLKGLKRGLSRKLKTVAANSFAEGWVLEAAKKANALRSRIPPEKAALIERYQAAEIDGFEDLAGLESTKTPSVDVARQAGMKAALDVQLHHGMDGESLKQLGSRV